jgi:hypothetical protein
MSEPHGKNIRDKLLFWFSLQGGCGGPKRVLFFSHSWVDQMDTTLKENFCCLFERHSRKINE